MLPFLVIVKLGIGSRVKISLDAVRSRLVHVDAQLPQIRLGQVNLAHQLLMRRGYIVEGHNIPTKSKEEICAKRDESPEGQLVSDFNPSQHDL